MLASRLAVASGMAGLWKERSLGPYWVYQGWGSLGDGVIVEEKVPTSGSDEVGHTVVPVETQSLTVTI